MSKSFRTGKSGKSGKVGKPGKAKARKKNSAGPIAFFVSLFIVALGTIQLVSTFHTYALNLAELNGLKREEASLVAKKQELENDIKRWDDKAYATISSGIGLYRRVAIAVVANCSSSVNGTALTSEVVFNMPMNSLPVGGMMMRMA